MVGRDPTTGWFLDPTTSTTAFAAYIVVLGSHANASFARLIVQGEPGDELFGTNVGNGVYYEGLIGLDPPPLSGTFEVRDSTFREVWDGTSVYNVRGGSVRILNNRFEQGVKEALAMNDIERVNCVFNANQMLVPGSTRAFSLGEFCFGPSAVCGTNHSTVIVTGNAVEAITPVTFHSTFDDQSRCLVAGNTLHADGPYDVVLGPGTRNCTVVTRGAVQDLGTGNRILHR